MTRSGSPSRPVLVGLLLAGCLGAGLAGAGCDRPGSPDVVAVRDSGGIEIVENMVPAGGTLERWHLSSSPELRIDPAGDDSVRAPVGVRGATRRSDGVLALVDEAGSIRLYAPDGEPLRLPNADRDDSIGRATEGPFPYRGDSLLVWLAHPPHLAILDRVGGLGRRIALEPRGYGPSLVGTFED
ncbi:MAG: hypothetical protein R3266_12030, partial [Gemmatimonadota bacterium]|nr:hypothetical protein [Gemmatimonadota bacterium]